METKIQTLVQGEKIILPRTAARAVTMDSGGTLETAFGQKAAKSRCVHCVLLASAWAGYDAPFTQQIEVDGLSETHNGSIGCDHNADFAQREQARIAKLCVTGQSSNHLVISADGELPDVDIPVVVTLLD